MAAAKRFSCEMEIMNWERRTILLFNQIVVGGRNDNRELSNRERNWQQIVSNKHPLYIDNCLILAEIGERIVRFRGSEDE